MHTTDRLALFHAKLRPFNDGSNLTFAQVNLWTVATVTISGLDWITYVMLYCLGHVRWRKACLPSTSSPQLLGLTYTKAMINTCKVVTSGLSTHVKMSSNWRKPSKNSRRILEDQLLGEITSSSDDRKTPSETLTFRVEETKPLPKTTPKTKEIRPYVCRVKLDAYLKARKQSLQYKS